MQLITLCECPGKMFKSFFLSSAIGRSRHYHYE